MPWVFGLEVILRIGLFVGIIWLWSLPASYFDEGPERCYWKVNYGIECPGCGLTRGTQHMLHGEWEVGWEYNPLSLVVAGGLIGAWLWNLWGLYEVMRGLPNMETPTQRWIMRWLKRMRSGK